MKKQLIQTADGSHSFYLEEMDEQYHSKHGSIAESQHVFIQSGLLYQAKKRKSLRIFELGMGTGLNVYLTAIAAKRNDLQVEMHSIEAFPLAAAEAAQLNYPSCIGESEELFQQIHELAWERLHQLSPNFKLKKILAKFEDFTLENKDYDLIYFDAFAPEKQEELWTNSVFQKVYESMKPGATLVTYCVKGVVRRRLQALGFQVEKLAGPLGGKREILRAQKVETDEN